MRPVEITWAGGEHSFLLTLDHLRALQDKCDAGPQWILKRLTSGAWLVDDIIQPIRLGLEGGGVPKDEARKLVKRHVEDEPLTLSVMTASAILAAMLFGTEDDPVGEQTAGTDNSTVTRSPEENGASVPFTNGQA
jgi:hypothetical protein